MSETGRAAERLELVATILLALATVGTAWSGYQASRWNGAQATAFSRASAQRIASAKADGRADTQTQIDVATFMQWVDATAQKQTALATFYEQRFRAEFIPAFRAWLATKPLRSAAAPPTPFAMPQYRLAARAEAERLDASGEALSAAGRVYVQRATNYVLCAVLFAAALFFAGISTKLALPRFRRILLAFGLVVFLATVGWIATFPVSFAV